MENFCDLMLITFAIFLRGNYVRNSGGLSDFLGNLPLFTQCTVWTVHCAIKLYVMYVRCSV